MVVHGVAFFIVEGRAHDIDDVIAIDLPFDVLEAVLQRVGMRKQHLVHGPFPQIWRTGYDESVAYPVALDFGVFVAGGVDQSPVAFRWFIVADCEFLRTSGERNEVAEGIEREFFTIAAYADDRCIFLLFAGGVYAENVDNAFGCMIEAYRSFRVLKSL